MKFKNYYKILELETNKVTIDQIKSAYRKQAKKYHPDVNVGDKLAEEKIKDVNEAYRILSNPSTKRKYDRTWNYNVGRRLNHTKTSGQMAGEIFGMFFGSGDTAESIDKPNEPAIRGEDIETEINISLEEGFYGANKTIVFKDLENKDKTITIKLPEGVQENEKIRLMGQGKTGKNGGKNGDMFIKINIEDDKCLIESNSEIGDLKEVLMRLNARLEEQSHPEWMEQIAAYQKEYPLQLKYIYQMEFNLVKQ